MESNENRFAVPKMSFSEREEIERLLKLGNSLTEIASFLGRSRSSIEREVRRGGGALEYSALRGQNSVRRNIGFSETKLHGMYRDIEALKISVYKLSLIINKG